MAGVAQVRLWRWVVLIPLLWALAAAQAPLFRLLVYDLRAVTVANGVVGENLAVTVDRRIRHEARLTWVVTVRNAETHQAVCAPSQPVPQTYDPAASAAEPVMQRSLFWLVGGKSAVDDCVSAGLGPGAWQLRVCHYRWGVWHACRDSNLFRLEERR